MEAPVDPVTRLVLIHNTAKVVFKLSIVMAFPTRLLKLFHSSSVLFMN